MEMEGFGVELSNIGDDFPQVMDVVDVVCAAFSTGDDDQLPEEPAQGYGGYEDCQPDPVYEQQHLQEPVQDHQEADPTTQQQPPPPPNQRPMGNQRPPPQPANYQQYHRPPPQPANYQQPAANYQQHLSQPAANYQQQYQPPPPQPAANYQQQYQPPPPQPVANNQQYQRPPPQPANYQQYQAQPPPNHVQYQVRPQPNQVHCQPLRPGNQQYQPSPPMKQQIPQPVGTQMNNYNSQAVTPGGTWSTDLFDCFNDVPLCCVTCWCPCIAFGQVAEIVDKGTSTCSTTGSIYALILFVTGCQFIYSGSYRTKMRLQYGIPGDDIEDFCTHLWCESCALLQEHKELTLRGYDVSLGWHVNMTMASQRQSQGVQMAPMAQNGMTR